MQQFSAFDSFNPKLPRSLDLNSLHSLEHPSVVCCVKFSMDGNYLATGCNRNAHIYDVAKGTKIMLVSSQPHLLIHALLQGLSRTTQPKKAISTSDRFALVLTKDFWLREQKIRKFVFGIYRSKRFACISPATNRIFIHWTFPVTVKPLSVAVETELSVCGTWKPISANSSWEEMKVDPQMPA